LDFLRKPKVVRTLEFADADGFAKPFQATAADAVTAS